MKVSYGGKKNRYFIILMIMEVISCFITNASYTSGVSSVAGSVLGFIVTPAQKLVSKTHLVFDNISERFKCVDELIEEN